MQKIIMGLLLTTSLSAGATVFKSVKTKKLTIPVNAGLGKVLASDANGVAAWATPVEDENPSPFTVDNGSISYTGRVFVLGTTVTEGLALTGGNESPLSTDPCFPGTFKKDTSYLYLCTSAGYGRLPLQLGY